MPGVMGFFGHPAFLAVTAVIAIGIVAYEFYQHHKAQNVSTGRRRRRRSNDRGIYLFEELEVGVNRDTNSRVNIKHPFAKFRGTSKKENEVRHRKHTSKVNCKEHLDQDITGVEQIYGVKSSSNEGERECDVTASFNPTSRSTNNDLDICNSHRSNSRLEEESKKQKDNIETEGATPSRAILEEDSRDMELGIFELGARNFSQSASAVEENNDCTDNLNIPPETQKQMENNGQKNGSDEMLCSLNRSSPNGSDEMLCSLNRSSLNGIVFENKVLTENAECEDLEDHQVPKYTKENALVKAWEEVKNSEREKLLCLCCNEKPVTTIVLPCAHKYTCEKCAPLLFQHYNKCPSCRCEIVSFKLE